jgi:hypothetical protein
LIIPNTYGLPVAFFGVPKENELAFEAVDEALSPLPADPLFVALVLELLDPHPAASSPVAATAAAALSHLERFICDSPLGRVARERPGQAAAASPR